MIDRDSPVTEDELHAFVDGELAEDRREAVEAWLAAHPDDAARLAAWRTQAELIRERYAAVIDEPTPERLDLDRLAGKAGRRRTIAVAAVLAAFLVGGAGGWLGRGFWEGGPLARAVTAEAIDAHRLYVVEVRHPVEVPASDSANLAKWLSKRVGYALRAPDLEAQNLKLLGGRLLPSPSGNPAAFFMYEGPTGERFTLYCRRSRAPQSALRYRTSGQFGAFLWVEEDVAFVVSGPPERERLHRVAEAAYSQIESHPRTSLLLNPRR